MIPLSIGEELRSLSPGSGRGSNDVGPTLSCNQLLVEEWQSLQPPAPSADRAGRTGWERAQDTASAAGEAATSSSSESLTFHRRPPVMRIASLPSSSGSCNLFNAFTTIASALFPSIWSDNSSTRSDRTLRARRRSGRSCVGVSSVTVPLASRIPQPSGQVRWTGAILCWSSRCRNPPMMRGGIPSRRS